jgi:hypothetical protein
MGILFAERISSAFLADVSSFLHLLPPAAVSESLMTIIDAIRGISGSIICFSRADSVYPSSYSFRLERTCTLSIRVDFG